MKITDIKVHLLDTGRDYHLAYYRSFKAEAGLVRVFTDEGIEGNADFCTWAQPSRLLAELVVALKREIVGVYDHPTQLAGGSSSWEVSEMFG